MNHIEAIFEISIACFLVLSFLVVIFHIKGKNTDDGSIMKEGDLFPKVFYSIWVFLIVGKSIFWVV